MRTLSELRSGLRDWVEEPQNAGVFTNTFIDRQLNRSLRKLALKILNKYPFFYWDTEAISTTDGTYLYAVPSDYWATYGIRDSDNVYLTPAEIDSFGDADDTSAESSDATHFGKKGAYIWLWPTPSATGTAYTHEYFKFPADMATASGSPDFPPGYEDLIELDAAIRCGVMDGADLSTAYAQYHEGLTDMMMTLDEWNKRQSPRVTFVPRFFGATFPNTNTTR